MPIETKIWKLNDHSPEPVPFCSLEAEEDLEKVLFKNIGLIHDQLLLIGRQVNAYGNFIDLLAIEPSGKLLVIELKRDRTPREVIAQVLDYGSWVVTLKEEDIAQIYNNFQTKYFPGQAVKTLAAAMKEKFGSLPEELNTEHSLMVVAARLDESSERIVSYLSKYHSLDINAVFFRYFRDGKTEYLTRTWLREAEAETISPVQLAARGNWNGEYYASFMEGPSRSWEEAKQYGFISAGGGDWYTDTLAMLSPGDRVWVNIPGGTGYVGVGIVTDTVKLAKDFKFNGKSILDLSKNGNGITTNGEMFVAVKWIKTVEVDKAAKEQGFFGNQNSVARPKTSKWDFTVKTVARIWGIQLNKDKAA